MSETIERAAMRKLFTATWAYCTNYLADEFDDPEFCGIDEKQHDAISAMFHALEDAQDYIRTAAIVDAHPKGQDPAEGLGS